ncbi:MAG: phage portal protein, partial [Nitrospirota bacterium]|nr:phage portal protein [Nitrospirota bacterium]
NIGMNNDDAQYLESRKFSVAEIARWYRVPPHMIGDLEKATFSNIEHQSIDFVVHTIRPWLVRIEQSIQRDLLRDPEKGVVFPSHTVDGLLRGDTLSRYQAYQLGINSGWLNRNEVRGLENRNQEDGLDEFLIPMNIDQQSERDSRLTGVVANMLANYEISGIKSEAKKSPEGFYEWLPEYYERVAGRMIEASVKKEDAEKYVLERIGAFRDFKLIDAVQHIERTALLEIGKLL